MAMTPEQFGQSIKAKYPQYKDVPDAELAQKVIAKYPVYKDRVDGLAPSEPTAAPAPEKKGGFDPSKGRVITPAPAPEKKKGIFSRAASFINREIIKPTAAPFLTPFATVAGREIFGAKPMDVFAGTGMATTKPGEALTGKEALGQAAMAGSLVVGGGGVAKVAGAARRGFIPVAKAGAAAGTKAGTLGGAAVPLMEDKGFKEAALGAAGGAIGGAVLGGAVPLAIGAAAKSVRLVGRGGQKVNAVVREIKSGRAREVLSGLDTPTINVLDPSRAAQTAAKAGKEVAEESLIPVAQQVEKTGERLEYYLSKAKRASQDASQATPLEFAGQRAEEALTGIQTKVQRAGQLKQRELAQFANKEVLGVGETKASLLASLEERVGATIQKGDVEVSPGLILDETQQALAGIADKTLAKPGSVINAPGRVSKISLDPSDKKLVEDVYALIDNLDDSDTALRIDGTVDAIQDLLYKRRQNVAMPVNSAVEGVLKQALGDLNGKVTRTIGSTYAKANRRYAAMIDVRDKLNTLLGAEGTKGGSLMKRVFSPSDAGTKTLFAEIEKITGINLVDESVLAKFAMEAVGDARQASLLESVIQLRPGDLKPTSLASRALEATLKRFGNKEAAARRVIEQARKRSLIPRPLPKGEGPLTTGLISKSRNEIEKPTIEMLRPTGHTRTVAKQFDASGGQGVVRKYNNRDIVLGDWAKTSQNKKLVEGKGDRFPESELNETLENRVAGFRGTGKPGEWRYDIMAIHSVMPDGQERIIYTRVNRFGQEEITGWHTLDRKKYPDFLEKLERQPPPASSRLDIFKKPTF